MRVRGSVQVLVDTISITVVIHFRETLREGALVIFYRKGVPGETFLWRQIFMLAQI